MSKKKLQGVVVSDKMKKTVIVESERWVIHPKYKKRYRLHKRCKAHNEKVDVKIGDQVIIEETKPISKDKRWRVLQKV